MADCVNIFDLLKEATQAGQQIIRLPAAVRVQLCGFDVVRLRLLTFQNVVALADFAAENPERWRGMFLHHMNPELPEKSIAKSCGVSADTMKRWLKSPYLDPESYWKNVPMAPEKGTCFSLNPEVSNDEQ